MPELPVGAGAAVGEEGLRLERGIPSLLGTGRLPRLLSELDSRSLRRSPKSREGPRAPPAV
jgi:hypothetical protein